MEKVSISLSGDKQLLKKLDNLAKKDIKRAVRKGTRQGNKRVQKKAKETAPKDTGLLRKSIKVRALPRSRVYVGTTCKAQVPYAGPLEYGTKYVQAREFMQKAAKQEGSKAAEEAAEVIKKEIIEATKK